MVAGTRRVILRLFFVALFFCTIASQLPAQQRPVFSQVDSPPQFIGPGTLGDFLGQHLVYPPAAQKEGLQGTVMVRFIVLENGKPTDFSIVMSPREDFSKAAMNVVKQLPNFTPPTHRNKPARVYMKIPVRFKLEN